MNDGRRPATSIRAISAGLKVVALVVTSEHFRIQNTPFARPVAEVRLVLG